tara:strand:+ start:6911 stop:8587 length:1677 start_codon:yes stop_codon:yes gene_type:complete
VAVAKDTGWITYRPDWYNDRVMDTYVSAPIVDKQGDMIPTDTIKEAMDFYMRYGVYSYRHEEMPIGLPLAYKVKNGKVKIKVGIHSKIAMHDKVWKEIKEYGPSGASSIRGEATNQEKVCLSENDCHNRINELSLWSISWVGDNPANPEAKVTDVAMAKSKSVQMTLNEVEGMVEKIIERKGSEYCLYAKKNRRLLGCHDTKEGAIRQERAIQARRFGKSDSIDSILTKIEKYKIPKGVKSEAITGRELRKEFGYGGGDVTKSINAHLINKKYVSYGMAMKIHKYYRRHEKVDPQGKNFDNKKRPSKGLIMWKMMGGDAGHSWSKSLQDKVKAEYQGRKVELNKPRRLSGDKKKFGVYVKNEKGNTVQVKFGDPKMDIKRDDPAKRRQFRARHNCDNPGPKYKARYWSCKMWSKKNVSDILNKAECPCAVKTERLQKANQDLDDIMRMIKFGTLIKAPEKKPKKKPKPETGTQPSGTWMANCKYNARKLSVSDKGNPFTQGRKVIRNEGAWCAELWRNPGKYDQQFKKPDGTTGRTSGMKLRDAVGRPSWKPTQKPPA